MRRRAASQRLLADKVVVIISSLHNGGRSNIDQKVFKCLLARLNQKVVDKLRIHGILSREQHKIAPAMYVTDESNQNYINIEVNLIR